MNESTNVYKINGTKTLLKKCTQVNTPWAGNVCGSFCIYGSVRLQGQGKGIVKFELQCNWIWYSPEFQENISFTTFLNTYILLDFFLAPKLAEMSHKTEKFSFFTVKGRG